MTTRSRKVKKIPSPHSPAPRATILGVSVFLTSITWLVFGETLHHPSINFDDQGYVFQNPRVTPGLTLTGILWAFRHSHMENWHPLTWISHMLDCQLFGLNPGGHHFTNVLLHTVAVILLFLVFHKMTGAVWRSAFVAAVFAIHPLGVESVAWVAERKDVLSGVFFMLTLGAYLRYVRAPGISRYLTLSIFLACGLMSKATFVTVPLVLLLLDYWPLQRANDFRGSRRLLMEKIPLLALSAAASVATVFAQTVTMASLEQLSLLARLKNAAVSVIVYLRQMFWPTHLAVFYPHPHDQLNIWVVLACVVLIVVLTLLAIFFRQKHPYVFVGWFWYLILLAPVLGIVQVCLQARAARFTYLPHS